MHIQSDLFVSSNVLFVISLCTYNTNVFELVMSLNIISLYLLELLIIATHLHPTVWTTDFKQKPMLHKMSQFQKQL